MIDLAIKQNIVHQAVKPAVLCQQAVANFTPTAVTVEAISPSHLVTFRSKIPATLFADYRLQNPVTIGFNTDNALSVLQLINKHTYIDLCIAEETHTITIASPSIKYTCEELNPSYVATGDITGQGDLKCELTLDEAKPKLVRGVKAANRIATECTLTFQSDTSTIVLCATGDTDRVRAEIPGHVMLDQSVRELDGTQAIQHRYSLDKLLDILRILPDDKPIRIGLTQESELIVNYPVTTIGEISVKLNNLIS